MNNGWIKLHRSFLDWEWYNCPNTARLFLHCLLKANHKDKKWQGQIIKRGTFLTSLDILSKETGMSVKSVRTSLAKLEKTGEIGTERARKGTKLSICNYGTYQKKEVEEGTPSGKEGAKKGQEKGKEGATTKNDKKEKEIEEILKYLNLKTGKNFRTAKGLLSRLDEGYTIEDCKKVIDIKVSQWLNDPKMKKFLRPDTLFSQKFDTYLNDEKTETFRDGKYYEFENVYIWQNKCYEEDGSISKRWEPLPANLGKGLMML